MGEYERSLTHTFLALAHPTRRRMLALLGKHSHRVTDLAANFDISLNVASKHLRTLERARLVRRCREGRVHRMEFDAAPLAKASDFLEQYRMRWERQLDRLGGHLDKMKAEEMKASHGKSRKAT